MLPQNAWHVNCQDPPDQYGVCDNWWVDSSTNDSYALFKLNDMEHNFFGLMEEIFGNNWTTGYDLFIGAAKHCFLHYQNVYDFSGGFRQVSDFPTLDPANFQSICFSNIRICQWDQENDLSVHAGVEFGDSCNFAWPNLCINGQGFSTEASWSSGTTSSVYGLN